MFDLHERLQEAVPPQASFSSVEVNRRADRVIHRRRLAGVAAMTLVVVATAGVARMAGEDPQVMLQSPETTVETTPAAALGVFDLPPLSPEERDASLMHPDPLPPGTRLAREVDGYRYFVAPSSTGGFCLAVAADGTAGHSDARCDGLPSATGVFILSEGQLAWLVPDGYDRATLPDGRTATVVNNVAVVHAASTDPAPETVTFTGPAGQLEIRPNDPPFPQLATAFPDGLTAGLASPHQDQLDAVAGWYGPTVHVLFRPDLSQVGLAVEHPDGEVWVAPRDEADGACLVAVPTDGSGGGVTCGPEELSSRWPFLASLRTAGGGWAALVAEGWDALQLPDGTRIPVQGHVLWLPPSSDLPETATLVGDGQSTPVALRHAVDATATPASTDAVATEESGSGQPITYSVFDQPGVPDDPRLLSIRDELAVQFPPESDPARVPDADTARLAYDDEELTVFAARPRHGEGICLITVPPAGAGGRCTPPPDSLVNPLPDRLVSSSPQAGVLMVHAIPDGYDTYVLDDGTQVPIPHNVLVVRGLAPADLSGELRGPAGTTRIDLGDPSAAATVLSSGAIAALADICPPDLPTSPSAPVSEEDERATAAVATPPQGLGVLPADGTGLPGQYEPSSEWTAFTRVGDPVLLGDATSLGASAARVVVSPIAAPLAADCVTMRLTIDQRDGQVIDLVTPHGPAPAVAVDGDSPLLIWIDQTSGVQLQLFGEGTADLDLLIAVAAQTQTGG